MHRGIKPAGQPRTLRTSAEGKAIPAKFDTPIEFDAQAGIPASTKGAGQRYVDVAEAARPPASAAVQAKRPFDSNCNIENGRAKR